MKSNFGILLFILFILFLTGAGNAWAQNWIKITHPSPTDRAFEPYFLNANIGFIFDVGWGRIELPNVHRTTDGGLHWKEIDVSQYGELFHMYFTAIDHGFATGGGVFETKDTGTTWKNLTSTFENTAFNSVYAAGNNVFAIMQKDFISGVQTGPLIVTRNDGKTWDTVFAPHPQDLHFVYVTGNKDSTVYVQYFDQYDRSTLLSSTDCGKSWISRNMDSTERSISTWTMGMYCLPHCNDLYRTLLHINGKLDDDFYYTVHTSDFGAHWDTLTTPSELGAWIAGSNCYQYISDADGFQSGKNRNGMWRIEDHGSTWTYIDGPDFTEIDDNDFHDLSVVGGGAVIYATDINHQLWKTTNGGDGTLSAAALASHISIDHTLAQGATVCDTSALTVICQNLSCNFTFLKDFSIGGLDSTQYSSEWRHHLAGEGLPDSLLVKIFPLYSNGGTYSLHAHFINDEFETIDTSVNFTLSASPGSIAAIYLKPAPMTANAGDTLTIPLYINSLQTFSQPGLASVTLHFSMNTELLTPFQFVPINGVTADLPKITSNSVSLTLHFDPTFSFNGETELGTIRCIPYVTDTMETDLVLAGASSSSGCLATLTDSNHIHFMLTGCGASMLSKFTTMGPAYDILRITPNPAGNSAKIQLRNNGSSLHFELLDALGVLQRNGTTGGNTVQLDLSGLPSGNYYFRLSGEKGVPVTQRLIIAK